MEINIIKLLLLLSLKKKKILSFATTWINPEDNMLSQINQTQKENKKTVQLHIHVESKKADYI